MRAKSRGDDFAGRAPQLHATALASAAAAARSDGAVRETMARGRGSRAVVVDVSKRIVVRDLGRVERLHEMEERVLLLGGGGVLEAQLARMRGLAREAEVRGSRRLQGVRDDERGRVFPDGDEDIEYLLEDTAGLGREVYAVVKGALLERLGLVRTVAAAAREGMEEMLAAQAALRPMAVCDVEGQRRFVVGRFLKTRQSIINKYQTYLRNLKLLESATSRQRRGCLTGKQNGILREWLFSHFQNPYPSTEEKDALSLRTGMNLTQINNWFINARIRVWKPTVELMTGEEMQREAVADPDEARNASIGMAGEPGEGEGISSGADEPEKPAMIGVRDSAAPFVGLNDTHLDMQLQQQEVQVQPQPPKLPLYGHSMAHQSRGVYDGMHGKPVTLQSQAISEVRTGAPTQVHPMAHEHHASPHVAPFQAVNLDSSTLPVSGSGPVLGGRSFLTHAVPNLYAGTAQAHHGGNNGYGFGLLDSLAQAQVAGGMPGYVEERPPQRNQFNTAPPYHGLVPQAPQAAHYPPLGRAPMLSGPMGAAVGTPPNYTAAPMAAFSGGSFSKPLYPDVSGRGRTADDLAPRSEAVIQAPRTRNMYGKRSFEAANEGENTGTGRARTRLQEQQRGRSWPS